MAEDRGSRGSSAEPPRDEGRRRRKRRRRRGAGGAASHGGHEEDLREGEARTDDGSGAEASAGAADGDGDGAGAAEEEESGAAAASPSDAPRSPSRGSGGRGEEEEAASGSAAAGAGGSEAGPEEEGPSERRGAGGGQASRSRSRRRRRRRRCLRGHRKRRRRRARGSCSRSGGSRHRPAREQRPPSLDKRPMVERVKGGVKLFVGRLPVEATQQMLRGAFAEYGEVLEVFLIDSTNAMKGARCAFVRLDSLPNAERAIGEMHEQRVLVPERRELGPIQVAFAKGEALRFGLGVQRETLAPRPGVPEAAKASVPALLDPNLLSKEALVDFVKECQRTGGRAFKQQWWAYCDSGKGGVRDYDPKRHSFGSLRQFFHPVQQGDWASKPWLRRAIQRAVDGGAGSGGGRRRRRRRKRRGGSDGSSSSSRSESSSNTSARARSKADLVVANMATNAARLRGCPSPLQVRKRPTRPPPPPPVPGPALPLGPRPPSSGAAGANGAAAGFPDAARSEAAEAAARPQRLMAPASKRDLELEAFLVRHRISPSTSFLMLKLPKQQAANVMAIVTERLRLARTTGAVLADDKGVEEMTLSLLASCGVRPHGPKGAAWTSTGRDTSPLPSRPPNMPAPGRTGGGAGAGGASAGDAATNAAAAAAEGLGALDTLLGPGLTDLPDEEEVLGELLPPPPARPGGRIRSPSMEAAATAARRAAPGSESRAFVKNLDKAISEEELQELFGKYGRVLGVEKVQGKGFAFITYEEPEAVQECVRALNFTKPFGRALVVEPLLGGAVPPEEPEPPSPKTKPKAAARPTGEKALHKSGHNGRGGASASSAGSRWSRYSPARRKKSGRAAARRKADSRSASNSSYSYEDSSRSNSHGPMLPPMGWHGAGMPPFPVPGMPGMAAPWDAPWGMPPAMLPPPPPLLDSQGHLVYDAEEAERQLRRAERQAHREARRRRDEPWEDHPARVKRRQRPSSSYSSSYSSSGSDNGLPLQWLGCPVPVPPPLWGGGGRDEAPQEELPPHIFRPGQSQMMAWQAPPVPGVPPSMFRPGPPASGAGVPRSLPPRRGRGSPPPSPKGGDVEHGVYSDVASLASDVAVLDD